MAALGCFKDKTSYNFHIIKHPILTHIPGRPASQQFSISCLDNPATYVTCHASLWERLLLLRFWGELREYRFFNYTWIPIVYKASDKLGCLNKLRIRYTSSIFLSNLKSVVAFFILSRSLRPNHNLLNKPPLTPSLSPRGYNAVSC